MRNSGWLWLVVILLILFACVGSGYLFYASPYRSAEATLPAEIQAAKQEGLPLTPADLNPAALTPHALRVA